MRNIICSVAVVAVVSLAASAMAAAGECCFTNPRFTGVCKVQPGEDETCADILAYLNNVNSAGKSYCGNTIIRGGWSELDCEEEEAGTACNVEPVVQRLVAPETQMPGV